MKLYISSWDLILEVVCRTHHRLSEEGSENGLILRNMVSELLVVARCYKVHWSVNHAHWYIFHNDVKSVGFPLEASTN